MMKEYKREEAIKSYLKMVEYIPITITCNLKDWILFKIYGESEICSPFCFDNILPKKFYVELCENNCIMNTYITYLVY